MRSAAARVAGQYPWWFGVVRFASVSKGHVGHIDPDNNDTFLSDDLRTSFDLGGRGMHILF